MAPMAMVSLLISPVAGILADRLDPRRLAITGFVIMAASFSAALVVINLDIGAWWMCAPIAVLGCGQSFIWGSNAATTMRDVPPELMGAASGVYNTSRQVGSVLGVAAVSAALQAAGISAALFVIIAVLVVGGLASLSFRDTLHGASEIMSG